MKVTLGLSHKIYLVNELPNLHRVFHLACTLLWTILTRFTKTSPMSVSQPVWVMTFSKFSKVTSAMCLDPFLEYTPNFLYHRFVYEITINPQIQLHVPLTWTHMFRIQYQGCPLRSCVCLLAKLYGTFGSSFFRRLRTPLLRLYCILNIAVAYLMAVRMSDV